MGKRIPCESLPDPGTFARTIAAQSGSAGLCRRWAVQGGQAGVEVVTEQQQDSHAVRAETHQGLFGKASEGVEPPGAAPRAADGRASARGPPARGRKGARGPRGWGGGRGMDGGWRGGLASLRAKLEGRVAAAGGVWPRVGGGGRPACGRRSSPVGGGTRWEGGARARIAGHSHSWACSGQSNLD
jgi:hypothetical protein